MSGEAAGGLLGRAEVSQMMLDIYVWATELSPIYDNNRYSIK